MSTPAMPPLYKLKTRAKYIAADIDNNVVVPNNLTVTNDSSVYGNLHVEEAAVFHNTVHIDNTSALNIITPQVNIDSDNINITSNVSVDTQKLTVTSHEDISVVADKKVSIDAKDDINIDADKKVSIVGKDDITISIPSKKLQLTGNLVIDSGDIVLNGMSVGELVSTSTRPIHRQTRFVNPFCIGIFGGQVAPSPSPSSSFLQGWYYSEATKAEYNAAFGTSRAKMNWYFGTGNISPTMKDFRGVNISTTLYNVSVPYLSIYTKLKPGENNGGWYQSRINFIYGNLGLLDGALATRATSGGLRSALTFGDYTNTQVLGFENLSLIYEKDFSVINTASKSAATYKPETVQEALEAIKDQEIFFYTIQTDSSTVNYDFIVHDCAFTETTTVGDRTFETSFINVLPSIMG
jgi:hypothetical protein